jgi:hypothetical protein
MVPLTYNWSAAACVNAGLPLILICAPLPLTSKFPANVPPANVPEMREAGTTTFIPKVPEVIDAAGTTTESLNVPEVMEEAETFPENALAKTMPSIQILPVPLRSIPPGLGLRVSPQTPEEE